jgi:hypothetical protein
MSDNIQVPVKVNIRELIEKYGSHFIASYDDDSLIEKIGHKDKHNEWSHQFATLEIAKKSILNKLEALKVEERNYYNHLMSTAVWKICSFLTSISMTNKNCKNNMTTIRNDLVLVEEEINKIQNKDYNIDVVMMEGKYNIPKYMPESGVTYYHLNLAHMDNVRINAVELNDEDSAIYDYRNSRSNDHFADQFDFKFSLYLKGEDIEVTLDSERLIKFNGKYWRLSSLNEFLFLDKKEALDFAKEIAEKKIKSLQEEVVKINDNIKNISV